MYTLILDETGYLVPVLVRYNNGQLDGATIGEIPELELDNKLEAWSAVHNNNLHFSAKGVYCNTAEQLRALSVLIGIPEHVQLELEVLAKEAESNERVDNMMHLAKVIHCELEALASDGDYSKDNLKQALKAVKKYL